MKGWLAGKSRLQAAAVILAANLFVLLITLLLGEGLLRFFHYPFSGQKVGQENALAQFDPELGWSYKPNFTGQTGIEGYRHDVFFDENGFRVPRPGFQYDRNRPSILFIGGSFTMGHGVSWEQSFVGRVAELLPAYQTVNLGVQAYGTDQALLTLKKYCDTFKTSIVVYTFTTPHILRNGNHDRRLLYPEGRFLGTKPLFSLNSRQQPILLKKPVTYDRYIHSYLVDLVKISIGKALNLFPPEPEDLTLALIREMKRYCEERGAAFLVVDWKISEDDYDIRETDLKNDINLVNVLENAPPYWSKMIVPDYNQQQSYGHPNSIAHDHVARLLASRIKNMPADNR